jgi:hypothetical protein
MKFLKIKRNTRIETRYTAKMGCLSCNVTNIWLTILGILPIKKLHSYRNTYYGEVKDLKDCNLHI